MKRSEFHLNQCLYHRTTFIHGIRLMKKRDEASFVDFDDFMKLYLGDHLLIEDVVEFFELLEVLFCNYNVNYKNFI